MGIYIHGVNVIKGSLYSRVYDIVIALNKIHQTSMQGRFIMQGVTNILAEML